MSLRARLMFAHGGRSGSSLPITTITGTDIDMKRS